MASSKQTYDAPSAPPSLGVKEEQLEYGFISKLQGLKYEYRPDIRSRATLERNFREKFEALNRIHLSDGEFTRLLDEIVTPDVYTAARTLRERNAFTRDDGTPLNYTLVNIKDWCKNSFEVVNQLRINTDNSHHRYDVLIFLETAELRTKSRQEIRMSFWRQNVDQIISSNGFPVLTHAGTISHAQMESSTHALYLDFDQRRKQQDATQADQQDEAELKALEDTLKRRPKK